MGPVIRQVVGQRLLIGIYRQLKEETQTKIQERDNNNHPPKWSNRSPQSKNIKNRSAINDRPSFKLIYINIKID